MKMLAHRHHAAPHGETHPVISISVLLTVLFLGAHGLLFTLFGVAVSDADTAAFYGGVNPYTVASGLIAVLLLVFLSVDYRRNRIEAHGQKRFQIVVFAVAALVLGAFLLFIARAILLGAPAA